MEKMMNECGDLPTRTRKNTVQLALWTGAWLLATALASFGPKLLWDFQTSLTIVGVLIQVGAGVGMIMANIRHLNGLDELMKKIQLDAMAVALGVGLVVGFSYEMLESTRLISFEPAISHLLMLMGITYVIGTIVGQRRYR